jgi:hypothetical protein
MEIQVMQQLFTYISEFDTRYAPKESNKCYIIYMKQEYCMENILIDSAWVCKIIFLSVFVRWEVFRMSNHFMVLYFVT